MDYTDPNPPKPVSLWLAETRTLMENRPSKIRLQVIAEACGVSVAWLSKLQTGKLTDAPISKVESLNRWLKENSLNVTV